jgi:type II secretory ATPase GspE/PulE/Tfp pilus assembly ATPase PilB-like protein
MLNSQTQNEVEKQQSKAIAGFDWPSPPYFSVGMNTDIQDTKTCYIYKRDGSKIIGNLLAFNSETSSITFSPIRGVGSANIDLADIKRIILIEPITLDKQQIDFESRAKEYYPASERQQFTVVYFDKEVFKGETIGHINTVNGIYLFTSEGKQNIGRTFIPHQAIESYQIGSKVGELLIEENKASQNDVDAAVAHQNKLRSQRIGDYLSEHKIITTEQLEEAIEFQKKQPILKLGEALRQLNLISDEQLIEALANQKQNRNIPLGQILIDMNVIDDRTLKGVLAKKMGIPFVILSSFNFDSKAINMVDYSLANKYTLIPLCIHEDNLIVAFENPLSIEAQERLRFLTQRTIIPAMASSEDIENAINKYYGKSKTIQYLDEHNEAFELDDLNTQNNKESLNTKALTEKLFDESLELETPKDVITESDSTLVKLINKMIVSAYEDGVSDIHIETYSGKQNSHVRFRKDGSLVPYLQVPASARDAMISRIKIMAKLDISERRKPQDGKINFQNFGTAKIELRVATIPTNNNLEDVVMRLLASSKPLPMEKLGLEPSMLNNLQHIMQRPNGLILVCGPTGSGKTTTLHSLLGYINTPERKIWTAEDPVEITQAGLRQVHVNAKIGWTFAAAMRSFLRADPDVIMVGEMRDEETTRIAIEASLTGHLVLSTLHTNSAPESIVRLLDMGMDPFNFADALQAVLAQRLAKSLCSSCKQPYDASSEELLELAKEYVFGTNLNAEEVLELWKTQANSNQPFRLYRAVGCKQCNNTGYRGRIGLHELMGVTPSIKHLIQTKAPVSEILESAIGSGMRTLKQDGIGKVLLGHTDISQIRSVAV